MNLVPKHITKEDILASINYYIQLRIWYWYIRMILTTLGNRRIRAVGELTSEPVSESVFPEWKELSVKE